MFEATFPSVSCTVYSSRIDLVFKFEELFEFVGQGVVWITDLRWLTAVVGTAATKKKEKHIYIYIHHRLGGGLGEFDWENFSRRAVRTSKHVSGFGTPGGLMPRTSRAHRFSFSPL